MGPNCKIGSLYSWLVCTSCVYLFSISAPIFSFKVVCISEHYKCTAFSKIKRLATHAFSSHEQPWLVVHNTQKCKTFYDGTPDKDMYVFEFA